MKFRRQNRMIKVFAGERKISNVLPPMKKYYHLDISSHCRVNIQNKYDGRLLYKVLTC